MTHPFDVVVVAPNTALDSYYMLPELTVGDVNRATEALHTPGGKGNNLARAVTMLGGRALSLGIVGGSTGRFVDAELRREGIEAKTVWAALETRRTSTIVSAAGQITVILENGSPVGAKAQAELTALVLAHAEEAPFLVFTGSLPPDFPDDYYATLIQRLKISTVQVAVDCAGTQLELAIQACPALVKVNAREFLSTFDVESWDWRLAKDRISGFGIELFIVTDGEHGAYVFSPGKEPIRVTTQVDSWINTTGAGDSFIAGLLVALNQGASLEQACRHASAAAAASLQQVTSGTLNKQDLEQFLGRTQIDLLRSERT